MTVAEKGPIVVGIDGSEPSLAAARWAATEARLRDRPLRLVYAYTSPFVPAARAVPPLGWPQTFRDEAEALVAAAVSAVAPYAGEVRVEGRGVGGPAAAVLVEASSDACLVVVGHRGRGGLASLLLGSVAAGVAAHAYGPVVVVRQNTAAPLPTDGTRPSGPVVVGIDGSPPSDAAAGFAFEEADLRGLPLTVAHAWTPPRRGDPHPLSDDVAELETAEVHRMRGWMQTWQEKFPLVPVTYRLIAAHPAAGLIDLSRGATLLAVGSRGHGGFAGLLLGSVSQQVLHHAHCPVAVVR
jgi:nucleotide-binding universal stress UspA family protein